MAEFAPLGELVDMRMDGDVAGLCRVARADDDRRAVQAVELLGGCAVPEAVDTLIGCCGREGDRYRGVRRSAVIALGKLRDRRAVPVLLELLNLGKPVDGPHLDRELYRALTSIGGPEVVAGLIDVLEALQADLYRAKQIVDVLADLRSPDTVPALLASLWQFRPTNPLPVVRALAAIGDRRAGAALLDLAGSDRAAVRRAAVEALHASPWPPPVQTPHPEEFLRGAWSDPDPGTARLAADLLSRTDEGRYLLSEALKPPTGTSRRHEYPPHAVVAACACMADHPGRFTSPHLHGDIALLTTQLRTSPLPAVRRAVARALGARAGAAATGDLLAALDDPPLTETVADVLAALPEPPVQDFLNLLTDRSRGTAQRRGAALALGLAGHTGAAAALLAALADDDAPVAVRTGAADALGALRHTRAAAPLGVLAADEEQPGALRARAVRALGLIGAPDTLPVVLACARSPHETVRERAVRALGSFPVPEAADALGALVASATDDGTDDGVALTALYALDRMGAPALPALTALTDRVPPDLAEYLVGALADRPEPEATAALGRLATTPVTYASQVYAAEKLSERRSPEAVAPLRALVVDDGVYGPTYAAGLRGLTAIGTEEAVEHVLAYCRATRYPQREQLDALTAIAAARAGKDGA
ncbi:HEAT repeat domain-containing protein [Streptomyces aureocirculatus]|uniref:HEAT repeat domain-containing protein n=1 Tax=Streptomyces aureocirculatus TaxID=67275 RepID=UPI00068EBFF3|nr:HEAT repeat domain-containing protein [Streptomyces aureocirculatus]